MSEGSCEKPEASDEFLSKLTDSQKHELVGRALQLQDQEKWNDLIERTAALRSCERTISFRTLTGSTCQLQLMPLQLLASVKHRILAEMEPVLPPLEPDKRRMVKILHVHEVLPDDMIIALLPDEVSVVFTSIDCPASDPASSSGYLDAAEWGWDQADSDRSDRSARGFSDYSFSDYSNHS
mmetsp:Transcript_40047/g.74654  ORF Transcript_40047/g.74654 Transcript_40047/m.74654 type:complete len:181 (-) Transcript_40047:93-635(-)